MKSKILLGYGTYLYNGDSESFTKALDAAYQSKYDYIDTAKYYQNETEIGIALANLRKKYGSSFHFPVQTKVWPDDYLDARNQVLLSMERLQLKQLDSVLLHRPSYNLAKDIIAWKDLIQLQKEGLVKQIGVSNYDNEMLFYFEKITNVLPSVNQIEFNLYNARYDRAITNQRLDVHIQAWRPLTNDIDYLNQDPIVQSLSEKYQTTPTGIAIAFIKALGMDPIIKSTHPERIIANAKAFYDVNLSSEDLAKLKLLNRFYDNRTKYGTSTYTLDQQSLTDLVNEIDMLEKNQK
ncbi:Aldo/keto reductase [[Mycoplasma] cavipharyngis]|uniref:aldo/keto reductase family protein n=1 Tax=[Mycoplasma] cavipharyngis TaxID=92757 RepID=UPI0037039D6C